MDELATQLRWIITAAVLIAGCFAIKLPGRARRWYGEINLFLAWRAAGMPGLAPAPAHLAQSEAPVPPKTIRLDTVPGGGSALLYPPDLRATLDELRRQGKGKQALWPIGWSCFMQGEERVADLTWTNLADGDYAIGVGGPTRHGKSREIFQGFIALADQLPPEKLQWVIFDLKEVDFAELEKKAYTALYVPNDLDRIKAAITWIDAEIKKRSERLRAARVTDWNDYPGDDLPLLLVYVSELSVLRLIMGNSGLNLWLNKLCGTGAAYGLRAIIDTQNFGNYDTHWREQIKLWVIGPMTSEDQDRPNTGLSAARIRAIGAVPPSDLPTDVKGIFTAVSGTKAVTVRTVSMTAAERLHYIDALPNRETVQETRPIVSALEATDAAVSVAPAAVSDASTPSEAGSGSLPKRPELRVIEGGQQLGGNGETDTADDEVVVSEEERQLILAAAQTRSSRRDICLHVFGSTGGRKYKKITKVLGPDRQSPRGTLVAQER